MPIMCRRGKAWERYLCTHIYRECCIDQHPPLPASVASRDAREGWPLLTVETEANGDSWSTNERGPSLVGSLALSCQYKRFLSYLGLSCPKQAVVPGRLSLNMCLWLPHGLVSRD